ncbi:MAG: hypothetical protein IJT98_08465 [Prevotella sp.]|nr:hypothetical protein [Prevotella sp.]
MKYLLLSAFTLLFFCGCKEHHNDEPDLDRQTVLVYIAGDNSLDSYVMSDVSEMMEASKSLPADCHLVLFIDKIGSLPYFMTVENGDTIRRETCQAELRTSSSETLRMAMQWTMTNYKARQYGLILWGHADGWMIKSSTAGSRPRLAYGQDTDNWTNTSPGTWMNIPDMARVLETLPVPDGRDKPLRFIFADCCCFQSVESAYELSNATDCIIASAAEIPGVGAPYKTVLPALFIFNDTFSREAMDAYFKQEYYGYNEPMSVVMTSEMDDLANATATVLNNSLQPMSVSGYPDVDGLIYYFERTLFDMNDFIKRIASSADYTEWRKAFDKAVPYKTMAPVWLANFVGYSSSVRDEFLHFTVTEERYGGMSMFVPQDPDVAYQRCMEETWNTDRYRMASTWRSTAKSQNEMISRMKWYKAAGLDRLGW